MSKRVAIIGAGCSGLAAIKCCLDEGLIPVCFERESDIGGLWNYTDDLRPGKGSVYASCVINTSKEMMAFSDFPVPAGFPPFLPHRYVLQYFRLYAVKFRLLKYIKFRTSVVNITSAEDYDVTGKWRVAYRETGNVESDLTAETFDAVLLCTGHHCYPHKPDIAGLRAFTGPVIHSHDYRKPNEYEGKRVLVIGIGNSAADIAVDLSRVASQVYVSSRRGAWVVARMGPFGLPMDALANSRAVFKMPLSWLQWAVQMMADYRFKHSNFGLHPEHGPLEAHPTINDDLPHRILTGSVKIKPDISTFTSSGVFFKDGTYTDIDAVVLATGYTYQFKFLDESILSVRENATDLYKYVFPPHHRHPTLGVVGLVQAIGAVMPISEMQCRWFTRVIKGLVKLPSKEDMMTDIRNKKNVICKQYLPSRRHTLQTYWINYMDEVASAIGARPDLCRLFLKDPALAARCFIGPCLPAQYRLQGPGAWSGARDVIFNTFSNTIAGTQSTAERKRRLSEVRENSSVSTYLVIIKLILLGYLSFLVLTTVFC